MQRVGAWQQTAKQTWQKPGRAMNMPGAQHPPRTLRVGAMGVAQTRKEQSKRKKCKKRTKHARPAAVGAGQSA